MAWYSEGMAKARSLYVCQNCGYSQAQWSGKCPECDQWNTLVETVTADTSRTTRSSATGGGRIYKLSDVKVDVTTRISTGEIELDSVLGGGLVAGLVILVAGEPGIGKSTLLLQIALQMLSLSVSKVLYVCGEESASQVALRAARIHKKSSSVPDQLWLLEETNVDVIISRIESEKPGLVIVDSIQTITTEDLTGTAGSVGQVRECAQRLSDICKRMNIPVFIVGHVTKEGNIAGPRVLEHLVDTVLWFEGERGQSLRLVRAVKNRFGSTDEVGVFEMTEKGLAGVDNPSQLFLAERVTNVPGSVVSVIVEGKRPLMVEIQALSVPSGSPVPRRVATGIDFARLHMLVAVLMSRAGLRLENMDIFVNVTGGIKLADRGIDLAICLAIASAFLNRSLPSDIAAVGEVGLLGEVRKVTGLERRVKEAKKLGYRVASAESGKSVAAAIKKLLKD